MLMECPVPGPQCCGMSDWAKWMGGWPAVDCR